MVGFGWVWLLCWLLVWVWLLCWIACDLGVCSVGMFAVGFAVGCVVDLCWVDSLV